MAVVKETLRRRPVIPIAARKALDPIELMGYSLPAGSVLMVSIYLIHGDPEIYPDPKEFEPERFLDADPKGTEGGAWIPFGGGIRRCLGASLAQYELAVVIRTVLEEAKLASWRIGRAGRPPALHASRPAGRDACASNRVSPGVSSARRLATVPELRSRFESAAEGWRLRALRASRDYVNSGCTASA